MELAIGIIQPFTFDVWFHIFYQVKSIGILKLNASISKKKFKQDIRRCIVKVNSEHSEKPGLSKRYLFSILAMLKHQWATHRATTLHEQDPIQHFKSENFYFNLSYLLFQLYKSYQYNVIVKCNYVSGSSRAYIGGYVLITGQTLGWTSPYLTAGCKLGGAEAKYKLCKTVSKNLVKARVQLSMGQKVL